MKALLKGSLFLLITIFLGCSLLKDDESERASGGSTDTSPGEISNADGRYDGVWRIVHVHEYEYDKVMFDQNPSQNSIEVDSGSEMITDTSLLIMLKKDSAIIYEYDDSENMDTFNIEYATLELLDEYSSQENLENLETEVMDGLAMEYIEGSNFDATSTSTLATSGDTLLITYGILVTLDWSSDLTGVTSTGSFEFDMGAVYKMVPYTGALPPESWPDNYTEERN